MTPEAVSTRPLLDKLGVKPGSSIAVANLDDPPFVARLRDRGATVVRGKPRRPCDLVFATAANARDLARLKDWKTWIEPNGAVWVLRLKGELATLRDTELIAAGLAAGLVDNKIASFSDTQSAMRFVFRLRDRPR